MPDPEQLPAQAPFHLEATARVLQRRPSNLVDVWERGRYVRVFEIDGRLVLVEVENLGTIDAPAVRYCIRSGESSTAVAGHLRRMLGLDVDPAALRFSTPIGGALQTAVAGLRGMRPPRFASLFETFLNVVPFQQLSLEAGLTIIGRLVQRLGRTLEYGGRQYYASPTEQTIAVARLDRLRACGLSRAKAQTLRDVARTIVAGNLNEADLLRMQSREALHVLSELAGIGPWSAALVLLRGLGRLDVFPPGDAGAARGLGPLLELDRRVSFDRAIERFGDRRGYLYFCGLGANLLARGLIHAAPAPARAAY
jgi:DNA-3-methyladenine glycosylase II